jgi:hypothetical protein
MTASSQDVQPPSLTCGYPSMRAFDCKLYRLLEYQQQGSWNSRDTVLSRLRQDNTNNHDRSCQIQRQTAHYAPVSKVIFPMVLSNVVYLTLDTQSQRPSLATSFQAYIYSIWKDCLCHPASTIHIRTYPALSHMS